MHPSYYEDLVSALRDENGLAPTERAMRVIVTVIESTIITDERHAGVGIPSVDMYALNAEFALSELRRKQT